MNDNQIKSLSGKIQKKSLSADLQDLQASDVISFCTMEYRNGYPEYDIKQFYAPFYIEFHNGEGWLLFSSTSIRKDRMNNQQWSSYHLKEIAKNITKAYLIMPDDIVYNEKEKKIAENYQKSITGNMYSAIDDVCYQSEMVKIIEEHSKEIARGLKVAPLKKKEPKVNDMAAEDNYESVLLGCYRDEGHLKWILTTMYYNVRLKARKGAIKDTYIVGQASRLLLYNQQNHNIYKYFTLSKKVERADYEKMKTLHYPNLQDGREYLLYKLVDELSSPRISVDTLIEKYKPAKWILYAPIFISFHGDIEYLEDL